MGGAPAPTRPAWVPAGAVLWRGHWFDTQTAQMLAELAARSGQIYVRPIQGCWSSSTPASAGTHARACVVDIDCEGLTDDQAELLVTLWRSMGGAGWFRPRYAPNGTTYGWQRHAHLFHPDGDMADELRNQWDDYLAGRNGLANNGPDEDTRAYVGTTWARYLAAKASPTTTPTPTPEGEGEVKVIKAPGRSSWLLVLPNGTYRVIGPGVPPSTYAAAGIEVRTVTAEQYDGVTRLLVKA